MILNKLLKRILSARLKNKSRRYNLNAQGIMLVNKLSPTAAELFCMMLAQTTEKYNKDRIAVSGSFEDYLWFKPKSTFYRAKSEIIKTGLILTDGEFYFINLEVVDCFPWAGQRKWLAELSGAKKRPEVPIMGSITPPPPPDKQNK